MTDFFTDKVTIYISIPAKDDKPRRFERRLIDKCLIQRGFVNQMDGNIQKVSNALTVITKDITRYIPTVDGLAETDPNDKTINHVLDFYTYTVGIGDFIVLDVVDDVVKDAKDFAALQQKYQDNGLKVNTINPYLKGMTVDNITISNI